MKLCIHMYIRFMAQQQQKDVANSKYWNEWKWVFFSFSISSRNVRINNQIDMSIWYKLKLAVGREWSNAFILGWPESYVVYYDNAERKWSWSKLDKTAQSPSKADIRQKRVMLCGVIICLREAPKQPNLVNSSVYYRLMMIFNGAIKNKRSKLANHEGEIFYNDNAR